MPLAIQIAALIVAALIGSGGLAVFLKYGTRMAIVEKDSDAHTVKVEEHTKENAATEIRLSLMESTMKDIRDSLQRLHVVDQIKTTCDILTARLEDNRKDTQEVKAEVRVLSQRRKTSCASPRTVVARRSRRS